MKAKAKVAANRTAMKKLWASRKLRAKMARVGKHSMKTLWARRTFRQKMQRRMKALWADPAFRAKMVKAFHEIRARRKPK